MADYEWSTSGCRPDVQWYGIPGAGSYQHTDRFGTYWIGGGIYQKFAEAGYECGGLGPPVKEYQWLSEFGAWGMWFEGGAIYYSGGAWRIVFGNYGQTHGRLAEETAAAPADAEYPPDPPVEPKTEVPSRPE